MFSHGLGSAFAGHAVAMPHSVTPFMTVYNIDPAVAGTSTVFTKLANPASLPTITGAYCTGADWTPAGDILAMTLTESPWVAMYRRVGNTLTRMANLPNLQASGFPQRSGSWHPSGQIWSHTSLNTSPYIHSWSRVGETFTKLADPASLPVTGQRGCSWNSFGNILTLTGINTPYITNYWWDGSTFTKLANPATLPTGTTDAKPVWSRDGSIVVIGHSTAPFMTGYWVNYNGTATTFTKLANPITNPGQRVDALDINFANDTLCVTSGASPYVHPYTISFAGTSTTFTRLTSPTGATGGSGYGLRFLPSGNLVFGMYNSPYWIYYTRSGNTFTISPYRPATLPSNNINGQLGMYPT
jgi:hypothetical protein